MKKIMFVCHGNICRSPMAEFVMKDMVKKAGKEKEFIIESSATSWEEHGNPVHYGTADILRKKGIPFTKRSATILEKEDYNKYDLFICMDSRNIRNALRILGNDPDEKIRLLMEYTGVSRDVADPWYTGDFSTTYKDINEGLMALLESEDLK